MYLIKYESLENHSNFFSLISNYCDQLYRIKLKHSFSKIKHALIYFSIKNIEIYRF